MSSPCIGVCQIAPDGQHCQGCHRSLAQIAAWPHLSEPERLAIMAALPRQASKGSAPSSTTSPTHSASEGRQAPGSDRPSHRN